MKKGPTEVEPFSLELLSLLGLLRNLGARKQLSVLHQYSCRLIQ